MTTLLPIKDIHIVTQTPMIVQAKTNMKQVPTSECLKIGLNM